MIRITRRSVAPSARLLRVHTNAVHQIVHGFELTAWAHHFSVMARSPDLLGLPGSAPPAPAATGVEALTADYVWGFSRGGGATVGLEEELMLVDPATLWPVAAVEPMLEAIADRRFEAEFRAAQLELVMPVSLNVGALVAELARARAHAVSALGGRVRLLAAGTHPAATGAVCITDRPRYRKIAADYTLGHSPRPAERPACPRRGGGPGRGARGLQRRPEQAPRDCGSVRELAVLRRSGRGRRVGKAEARRRPAAERDSARVRLLARARRVRELGGRRRPLPRPRLPLVGSSPAAGSRDDRVPGG